MTDEKKKEGREFLYEDDISAEKAAAKKRTRLSQENENQQRP
jgi:hypothetical protein